MTTGEPSPSPVARLTGVGLRYGKVVALDGITLDIPAGRMVGLLGPDGVEHTAEGRCDGTMRSEPAGGNGFGYDPLFEPAGFNQTYAELDEATKNRISHRAQAWARLARALCAPGPG